MKRNKKRKIKFTTRQLEVISVWWSENSDVEATAHNLGISTNTVQTHLRRMRKKLGVKKTWEIYKFLIDNNYMQN